MLKRLLIPALALGLALLITSCAQQNIKNNKTDAKRQLAEHLLGQAVYIQTLFSECEILGGDVEIQSIDLQQDWLQKSWALIAAADAYYTELERSDGLLYEGQLISLNATLIAHEARQKALDELNFSQRTTANQQRYCNSRMQKMAAEEINMAATLGRKHSGFNLASTENSRIQIDRIPDLAFKTPRIQTPGRTWFPLEEGFKQECAKPRQLLLLNDWPKEAYAVYCDKTPLALMMCEWGKCERKQE